jgi:hypothetical protein
MNCGKMLFVLSAAVLMAGVCRASIIQTNSEIDGSQTGGVSGTATIAASTNLITQGQSTFGSLTATGYVPWSGASGVSVLNNNSLNNGIALDTTDSTWTLTATLNTATNTKGYDITGITTISGWNVDYVNQKYTVYYSTVSDPTNFIFLGDYALNNTNMSYGSLSNSPTTLQIALTDGSGVIVSNVAAIQFVFQKSSGGTYNYATAYREIEVFGTASTTVPEPSTTMMMLTVATAGLLAYAWRKRRR